MWSYYSDSHSGYCFRYETKEIFKQINNVFTPGLCIVGDVIYTEKRPKVKNPVNKFSFTDIKFYIDASFQKYSKWEHKEEYRFVLILEFFEDDYFTIRTPLSKVFSGVSSSNDIIQDSNRNDILTRKIKKDDKNYKLIST